jgi:hypothetical protein
MLVESASEEQPSGFRAAPYAGFSRRRCQDGVFVRTGLSGEVLEQEAGDGAGTACLAQLDFSALTRLPLEKPSARDRICPAEGNTSGYLRR